MAIEISINIGFITNSSSVVHHFPRELLDHPGIQEFMRVMGIKNGFVGDDLWGRSSCSTVAVTQTQREKVFSNLQSINDGEDYPIAPPSVEVNGDAVVIVYGDEYTSVAATLAVMLKEVAESLGISYSTEDFN